MELTSPAFKNTEFIPIKYTGDGNNINPPLNIHSVPAGTLSLALIVDDPDAPSGDWVHWLVWNIDPKTTTILENSVLFGAIAGLNDFGHQAYGGPMPPAGTHRYQFKLYAVDTHLDLSNLAHKLDLEKATKNHILEQTMLIGLYKRS